MLMIAVLLLILAVIVPLIAIALEMFNLVSWETPQKALGASLILILISAIFFGVGIYQYSNSPEFSLKKSEWDCTASHTYTYATTVIVGKIPITHLHTGTMCDVYTRK